MKTTYRHLASEVGCLSAEIYREIHRCLRLPSGVVIDGVKWISKTAEELSQLLGCNEKTVQRHLKQLVEIGWLKREQLQKQLCKRVYYYTLGDNAPLEPVSAQKSLQSNRQGACH
ncbi:helix-turn-helix domain-containing protein [Synechococcus sp. M16CYN]|uniref:helix-turn-helix domain-containing protein n=1 Tax=Synechococcus sp. M16CYN TaxID=3103139 RepID=UPI0030E3998F